MHYAEIRRSASSVERHEASGLLGDFPRYPGFQPAGGIAVDDVMPGGTVCNRLDLCLQLLGSSLVRCSPEFLQDIFERLLLGAVVYAATLALPRILYG